MNAFNTYLIGVGGQGIGLLSEVLIRAADYAGHRAKAVDTHGLAQRGGTVVSHLRLGDGVHAPLVPAGEADLVVALERNEALRGLETAAKDGGALVYYDTVWQPLGVRLGQDPPVNENQVAEHCRRRNIRCFRVWEAALEDPRMQNMAVLAEIGRCGLLPGVEPAHYRAALQDLLAGGLLTKNLALFDTKVKEREGQAG